ncbi:TonB-dependent receptor domain-containing protein [Parasphingorhabdus sp.]|uniref:TonB-dependent receptor domain-containing protein n=1 Tax=Parasphingorhabdus sp. TaxID=2709688 RepID=UPI0035949279
MYRAASGCTLVVLSAAIAPSAYAQQAALQIAVIDAETGAAVAGIEVVIENRALGMRRIERSNDQGMVRLAALTTGGAYTVSTTGTDRYESAKARPVVLRSNFASSVTLRLYPVDADAIVVTGSRAVTGINIVNAEISASLSDKELQALPIEGRDVIGSLIRLPNVVASTGFFPEAPGISINGSNGLDTNYLIDGLDNNENFLGGLKFPVPLGFTREVTVLANNYSVAYGRTANGIVNYTSPSGSNEYHGEVYALVRPGRPLDARSAFPRRDLSGNPVGESFERYQTGASIGGPIIRDKTFFYANFEYTRDHNEQIVDAPALGTVANVTGNNEFYLGSIRLDHRLNDDWAIGLRANIGRVTIDRPGGALGGGNVTFPSAGSDQDRFSTVVAATASHSGDDWSYDGALQFSRFRWDYARPKGPPGPQVAIQDESGLTTGVVGHPGFVFNDLEETWQTTNRLQRKLGNHRISFGADLMHSDFALLGGGNPDGNFIVQLASVELASLSDKGLALSAGDVLALNPAVLNYSVELRPQTFGTGQTQLAFYIEDEWQVSPKLTATLGVRWDYDSLTAKGGTGGDKNNFAPRLALNYHPDGQSSFRFGAGLFYGKLSYAVISDALQRNTTSPAFLAQLGELQGLGIIPPGTSLSDVTFNGNLTVSPVCTTVDSCPSPSDVQALRDTASINEARILNPDGYQSPYSLQLSGGYQYQATDTITLSADIIYSRSHNLVRLRDLNTPAPFTPNLANLTDANIALLRAQPDNTARFALAQSLGLVRSQADSDTTRPVALVPGGARQITVSETAGAATYRALNLQANKLRGEDFYAFRLSYTLSKLTNDTDDINFRASDANDFSADKGPSANDRRHVISAVGFLYPVDGLTLTVAGLFQSGQPVNLVPDARIFGTQDLNGDGASFGENFVGNSDRYPGTARNSARLPWSASVDVGIRYAVPVFAGRLELSADVFNLLNSNNQSGFANAATTSNQLQFGGGVPFIQRNAGPPRQFQFGAAWKF